MSDLSIGSMSSMLISPAPPDTERKTLRIPSTANSTSANCLNPSASRQTRSARSMSSTTTPMWLMRWNIRPPRGGPYHGLARSGHLLRRRDTELVDAPDRERTAPELVRRIHGRDRRHLPVLRLVAEEMRGMGLGAGRLAVLVGGGAEVPHLLQLDRERAELVGDRDARDRDELRRALRPLHPVAEEVVDARIGRQGRRPDEALRARHEEAVRLDRVDDDAPEL